MSTKLIIKRNPFKQDRKKNYTVYVDGKPLGEIASGATETFEIEDGEHTIKVKMKSLGSKTKSFVCKEETIQLECGNDTEKDPGFARAFITMFDQNNYLYIRRTEEEFDLL